MLWSWKTDFELLPCPDFLLGSCKYFTSVLQWGFQKRIIWHVHWCALTDITFRRKTLLRSKPQGCHTGNPYVNTTGALWQLTAAEQEQAHLSAKVLPSSLLLHWCLWYFNDSGNCCSPSVNLVTGQSWEVSKTTSFWWQLFVSPHFYLKELQPFWQELLWGTLCSCAAETRSHQKLRRIHGRPKDQEVHHQIITKLFQTAGSRTNTELIS